MAIWLQPRSTPTSADDGGTTGMTDTGMTDTGKTQADKKRIVVVGASTGLGRCIGIGFAERGERVALMARRLDKIQEAAQEAGHDAIAIACDAIDPEACTAALDDAAAQMGGIDTVI